MSFIDDAFGTGIRPADVFELAPHPTFCFHTENCLVYRNKAARAVFGVDSLPRILGAENYDTMLRGLKRAKRSSIPTKYRIEHDNQVYLFHTWRTPQLAGRDVSLIISSAEKIARGTTNSIALSVARKETAAERERARVRIRQLKSEAAHLKRLASTDALTNLLNARAFMERLQEDQPRRGCLLYVDLDCFKTINDTHGHVAGDAVLQRAAGALAAGARSEDPVGRLGGDEFAIWARGLRKEEAEGLKHRLAEKIAEPFSWRDSKGGELMLVVRASIGIAEAEEGQTVSELISEADFDMYQGKNSRRTSLDPGRARELPMPAAPVKRAD